MAVNLPLSRFKVLDLTIARAGPACVRTLADWGADVIRIEEPPTAKMMEEVVGKREGVDFQNLHRNKRAITLDLKTPEGKEVFYKLVSQSDVIVENMRPNVKYRLNIDYDTVSAINPRIVYGSISGFGQHGPYAERAGLDQVAQGMSGLMSVTGKPGGGPVRIGIALCDLAAGAFLAQGLLIALLEREATGKGRWVHTSLMEAAIALLDFQAARYLTNGEVAGQEGNFHPTVTPTGVYPTLDGHVSVAASSSRLFERLCDALGAEDLLSDPKFSNSEMRKQNRSELNRRVGEYFKAKETDEWVDLLNRVGVPCGPIYSIDQTFNDPQVRHLKMGRSIVHPMLGELNLVASPLNIDGYDKDLRAPTPGIGENTFDVMGELGYTISDIENFLDKKVM